MPLGELYYVRSLLGGLCSNRPMPSAYIILVRGVSAARELITVYPLAPILGTADEWWGARPFATRGTRRYGRARGGGARSSSYRQ